MKFITPFAEDRKNIIFKKRVSEMVEKRAKAKDKKIPYVFFSIHYGTQLMPSVVFLPECCCFQN